MKKYLVGASALALSLTVAGISFGSVANQSIVGKVCSYTGANKCGEPRPLPNTGIGAPVQMKVFLANTQTPANTQPDPSRKAVVKFDNSIAVDTKGLKYLTPGQLSDKTTAEVRSDPAFAPARVGQGIGHVCVGTGFSTGDPCGSTIDADITAFNGKPTVGAHPHPKLLLHVSNDALGTAGQTNPDPMVGVLTKTTGDLGNVLTVATVGQPALGGLTDFNVNLKRHWRYQGRGHDYLHAVCNDSSHKLNYKATVTFDNVGDKAGNDTSTCS